MRDDPDGLADTASTATAPAPGVGRWGAWDAFLQTVPATGFMQSSWWADFRASTGYEHFGVVLRDRGEILGGALVLKLDYEPDRCFYYIPEGPVVPAEEPAAGEVFQAALDAIDERRRSEDRVVSHLRVEPRWERLPDFVRGFRAVPEFADGFMEPRNTLCIDLRASEDEILAQMKSKGRYNIRVARKHGVSVVEDPSEQGLADFLSIYEEMTSHQGIEAKPPDYFQALVHFLTSQRQGTLYFAEYEGERIAGSIVVHFGRRTTYFFGGSLHAHRNVMAPYLLHFETLRRAKAAGQEWYDLWGVAPENEPDHPWRGISEFKRKFGGVEVGLVPTLDYVYDAAAYEGYVASDGEGEDS